MQKMKTLGCISFAFFFFLGHFNLYAEQMNIKDAIKFAESNSPLLLKLQNELEIAKLDDGVAQIANLPKFDLYSNYSVNKTNENSKVVLGNKTGLQMTENIYDNGLSNHKKKLSSLKLKWSQLSLSMAREELSYQLVDAFYKLSMQKKFIKMQEDNLKNLEKQFNAIELAYKQGLKSQNDYLRIKIDVQNALSRLNNSKGQLVLLRYNIERIVGSDAQTVRAYSPVDLTAKDLNPSELSESKIAPSIARLDLVKQQEQLAFNRAKEVTLPEINAKAFAGVSDGFTEDSFFERENYKTHIELTLNIQYTIWDWGEKRKQKSIAQERFNIAQQSFREGYLDFKKNIKSLDIELDIVKKNYELNKSIAANSAKSFSAIQENYKRGIVAYLDLANAFKDLLSSQESLVRSEYELALIYKKQLSLQGLLYDEIIR